MKVAAVLVAGVTVVSSAAAQTSDRNTTPMIVQMSYYAKPGMEDEVLRLRLLAAEVLVKRGLDRGRVWRSMDNGRATREPIGATVIWQGEFANAAMLKQYEDVADKDPDFLAIRREMATVTVAARTERRYYREARPSEQRAQSDVAAEVMTFERAIEAAVVRGDVGFVDAASAPTFTFTHGDGWTTGGAPLRVDSRADWLATVAKAPYESRELDSVKTEVHGDVVITYGRYVGRFKSAAPGRRQFTVWYERVYATRDGQWQYLSHRTVNGPVYEKN